MGANLRLAGNRGGAVMLQTFCTYAAMTCSERSILRPKHCYQTYSNKSKIPATQCIAGIPYCILPSLFTCEKVC